MAEKVTASRLIKKILLADRRFSLFAEPRGILAALSGGADSCALFYALCELRERFSFSLCAIHVNHLIRGAEAFRDEEFAAEMCRKESVALFVERVDIPAIAADKRISVELAARQERYRLYDKICEREGLDAVATAHTASDNAETLLFHLIRGSALDGLCGIPPKRGRIIRPLILARREDVEQYLRELGKGYVSDSTNADIGHTRNFIRHVILPEMKKINGSLERGLTRTALSLREDRAFFEDMRDKHMTGDIKALASMPRALLSRVIRKLYEQKSGAPLEQVHTEAVIAEIKKAARAAGIHKRTLSLPRKITATITQKELVFQAGRANTASEKPFDIILNYGENIIHGTDFMIFMSNQPFLDHANYDKRVYKLFNKINLFSDRIIGNISARSRKSGDQYVAGGLTRSVKKMLIDKKIPQSERGKLPVLYDGGGIIWIAHCPVCDRHNRGVCAKEPENSFTYLSIYKKAAMPSSGNKE